MSVLVASTVKYWQIELIRRSLIYAAVQVFVTCWCIEKLLSSVKPRFLTRSEKSTSISPVCIDWGISPEVDALFGGGYYKIAQATADLRWLPRTSISLRLLQTVQAISGLLVEFSQKLRRRLQDSTSQCRIVQTTVHDTTGLPVESTQRLDRRLQDSTSQCRIVQATTGLYRTLQNYTGRHSVTLATGDCMGHIEGSIPQDCTSQSPIV